MEFSVRRLFFCGQAAPMLFESALAALYKLPDKTETPVSLQHWSSWWARVDSNKLNYHNSLDAL